MAYSDLIRRSKPKPSDGYDGLLVYSFGNQSKIQKLPDSCEDGRPLIIAYTAHENQIKELVLEAAAARKILGSPELNHDGVARKEVRFRIQASEDLLREYIGQIYAPASDDATWHIGKNQFKIKSYRELSSLISELCDLTYAKCPPIGNEMINYEQLSPSAARARRELAEAMTIREEEGQLGMTGLPRGCCISSTIPID